MSEKITRFLDTLVLSPREKRQYNRIVKAIRVKRHSEDAYSTFYSKVLASDKYSYDVKQKSVLWMYALEPSRKWGFENLTGEALFLYVEEAMDRLIAQFSLKEMAALATNPAFLASRGTDFDLVDKAFDIPSGEPRVSELLFRRIVIYSVVASGNMNLDLAELILEKSGRQSTSKFLKLWQMDEKPIIEWARDTYGMDGIPDLWVRQFLVGEV